MRIILFKRDKGSDWERYVDIGSCERDYNFINFYLHENDENKSFKLKFNSYQAWYDNFKTESIGSKMVILRYYISEFMGWNQSENTPQIKYFQECYGKETYLVINDNLDFFLEFTNKWFLNESPIFKCLDFGFDDIENQFIRTETGEGGSISKIEFEDGSMISFIDDNDFYKSVFVPETEFQKLDADIEIITNKFMPIKLNSNK